MPFRIPVLLCASIAAAIATLSADVVQAEPLFYDYMDARFGVAAEPIMGDTFMVTPLQAPGLLPVYQLKVGDTVSITTQPLPRFSGQVDAGLRKRRSRTFTEAAMT